MPIARPARGNPFAPVAPLISKRKKDDEDDADAAAQVELTDATTDAVPALADTVAAAIAEGDDPEQREPHVEPADKSTPLEAFRDSVEEKSTLGGPLIVGGFLVTASEDLLSIGASEGKVPEATKTSTPVLLKLRRPGSDKELVVILAPTSAKTADEAEATIKEEIAAELDSNEPQGVTDGVGEE